MEKIRSAATSLYQRHWGSNLIRTRCLRIKRCAKSHKAHSNLAPLIMYKLPGCATFFSVKATKQFLVQ